MSVAYPALPSWVQAEYRARHYPPTEFYIGFSQNGIKNSPSKDDFSAIEKSAQNKLSESIVVKLQSNTSTENKSSQKTTGKNSTETISKDFKQEIKTESNIILAKVETKSYFDEIKGYIYAFAFVRKSDLSEFYKSKIDGIFSFAEKSIPLASQLAENGKKKNALEKINTALDSLSTLGIWKNLLQTVDYSSLQTERGNLEPAIEMKLFQKLQDAKQQYENSVAIFLKTSGNDYLTEQLPAALQEKGCNCIVVEQEGEADYSAAINAKFSHCIESKFIYCYTNATLSVKNSIIGKRIAVKIPEAKGGWAKGSKEKATEESFKYLTNSIAEKIIQSINQ